MKGAIARIKGDGELHEVFSTIRAPKEKVIIILWFHLPYTYLNLFSLLHSLPKKKMFKLGTSVVILVI